jgi:hypothetical protein
MKKKLLPAGGIVAVALILLAINEFTDTTVIKDFALLFIVAGMLFGFWLARMTD